MADQEYPESVVRTRRRAVGLGMQGAADAVRGISEEALTAQLDHDMVFIEPKEQAAIDKLKKALGAVEKNLNGLAKRLGVE